MSAVVAIAVRELRRSWSSGAALMPVAFFLLVATLFPFAIGPDTALLARVAGGVVWTAALLAALLPVERLVAPDLESGVLDQLSVRGFGDATVAAAKIVGHWLGFAPSLLLAVTVASGLLGLSLDQSLAAGLSLLVGTPGLAACPTG